MFICCCSFKAIAHEVGHYHQKNELNTWTLASGKTVKGNFFMAKGNAIVLEQTEGKLIVIPVKELAKQDMILANFKIKKFKALNNEVTNLDETKSIRFITNKDYSLLGISVVLVFLLSFLFYYKKSMHKSFVIPMACISFLVLIVSFIGRSNYIPKTNTAFIDSAFASYKPAVQTSFNENYFLVASNGIPNHNMMVGITSWQQQVPLPQNYTGSNQWSIPLQPEYASSPISTKNNFMRGAVALAVNGIPIFNALNNRGEDAYLIGELDQWGGHCGKGDDYHYHAAPLHLAATSGLKPIAFALDGFAVYASKEPDGTAMKTLDECHGHNGTNGVYHYHGTNTYPYVIGAMKGKVQIDASKPAPENQIIPQAFAKPVRPPLRPLRGAVIKDLKAIGLNDYTLTYELNNQTGYVNYTWDNNSYYFTFTDVNGVSTKETYQRRKER
jgi:hypothetical protein